jgi:hypothetical protein
MALKAGKAILLWMSWVFFLLWIFLSVVRSLLWVAFIFHPDCRSPWLIVWSLIAYCCPIVLFIWFHRSCKQPLNRWIMIGIGLACLTLSEGLVSCSIGPNSQSAILWQALVIFGMFVGCFRRSALTLEK